VRAAYHDKQTHIVLFSSTAIALYGYDQASIDMCAYHNTSLIHIQGNDVVD